MNASNLPSSSGISALGHALETSRLLATKTVESGGVGSAQALRSPSRPTFPDANVRTPQEIVDRVEISEEARALLAASEKSGGTDAAGRTNGPDPGTESGHGTQAANGEPTDPERNGEERSEEDQAQVRELQARDRAVRAHENAHAGAGGAFAGSPSYEYQEGPDGRRYAVGGEVPISVREGSSPGETVRNAQQVRAAALAPSDPSSQDLRVAARAASMESDARAEMAQASREELYGDPAASGAAGNGEAPFGASGITAPVETGGSLDARVAGYGQTPQAVQEDVSVLDLFG